MLYVLAYLHMSLLRSDPAERENSEMGSLNNLSSPPGGMTYCQPRFRLASAQCEGV